MATRKVSKDRRRNRQMLDGRAPALRFDELPGAPDLIFDEYPSISKLVYDIEPSRRQRRFFEGRAA